MTTRIYAVSSGDGNNGVAHSFPDYYVKTDQPYWLARLAMIDSFRHAKGRQWALEHVEVDGEPEYIIAATISEGPHGETAFGAAWAIIEVFPSDGPDMTDPWHRPVYESIEDAISEDALALLPSPSSGE